MKELKFNDLIIGDQFKLLPKNDKRVFERTKDGGAVQVRDHNGNLFCNPEFKVYCYLTMPIYIDETTKNGKRIIERLKRQQENNDGFVDELDRHLYHKRAANIDPDLFIDHEGKDAET